MKNYIDDELLKHLVSITSDIAKGNYYKDISKLADRKYPDTITQLAESFGMMMVRIQARELRLENILYNTAEAFAEAIDAKSPWTSGHSKRVTQYAISIAKEINSDEQFIKNTKIAALLHDIGKIGIPEKILNKRSVLNKKERRRMQHHSSIGAKIVEHIEEFTDVVPAIRYHHERFDGSGYPEGLEGESIPLIARILAVADGFDCLISDRPYKKKQTKYKAYRTLMREKNKQWDGKIVDLFINVQRRKNRRRRHHVV